MEGKELKIVPPDGYIVDESNSTFECIKFKKKLLTYEDVDAKLHSIGHYYISCGSNPLYSDFPAVGCPNAASSKEQLEKLLAINKLMNVAKYLNGDWKPKILSTQDYWYIFHAKTDNKLHMTTGTPNVSSVVYFKTAQLAQQAIDILGEDTIKLALSTDW